MRIEFRKFFMTLPDSGVEQQLSVTEAQEQLGIGKDAYGDRRKFLGIQHIKGENNRAYLSLEDFRLMESLGEHIKEHGKMEGFTNPNSGELTVSNAAQIGSVAPTIEEIPLENDLDELIRAAAELKGQRLAMPHLVVQALADKMTYEDLPQDVKAKVDQVRENVTAPKPPSQLADQILANYRSRPTAA